MRDVPNEPAHDFSDEITAQGHRQRAKAIALESMAEAAGSDRTAPTWSRDELRDRDHRD